uniref:Uncharacterized protein LOC114346833 n=1 Tax=Diabrotica virgifera virgifera TaxID=50390 RepID=A0A6P7GV30_DIAVI
TLNGQGWLPKKSNQICSSHFIGGRKSDALLSPSFVPTLFVSKTPSKRDILEHERNKRFMTRRFVETTVTDDQKLNLFSPNVQDDFSMEIVTESTVIENNEVNLKICSDQACQYVYQNYVDAEVQTDISGLIDLVKVNKHKKFKDKSSNTSHKTFVDTAVGSDEPMDYNWEIEKKHKYFEGYSSVTNKEEFLDLTGVSFENFDFLLHRFDFSEKNKVSDHNRLFIFLMKLKSGLSFGALGAIFRIHRTTISKIFFSCLNQLAAQTKNFVFWPDQETVRALTPDCFKPEFSDTRVILDCTEFRIDIPASIENRVFCYSHYKHGFTFKLLLGINPNGFICCRSKAYGGRISDSQITIESGIINLLEHGDTVLADKGFPEFQNVIDNSGKKIMLVMPPFLKDKKEFTKEETEKTYGTARVRIHVERIMQRLRIYRILDKIPEHLFSHIDKIIDVCCILVNLQPPIISHQEPV